MTAQFKPVLELTRTAGTGGFTKYRAIERDLTLAEVGEEIIGVAIDTVAAGAVGRIVCVGTVPVEASAAITVGAKLGVAASGKAVTYTAGAVLGTALQAAGADTEVIEVLLQIQGAVA